MDPVPNLLLLRRILRQIDAEPKTWRQDMYAIQNTCGTAYCIAGHAAVMSGHQFKWEDDDEYDDFRRFAHMTKGGRNIDTVARKVLGLTHLECQSLFNPNNTRADIEYIANEIARRAGEPLWPKEEELCGATNLQDVCVLA